MLGLPTEGAEEMSSEKTPIGIYWRPAVWDLARSAYVADLDTDPESPGAFLGWLDRALERHARRAAKARAAIAAEAADQLEQATTRNGFNRAHRLRESTIDALRKAIVDDRRELGRYVSVSGLAHEAVIAAAQEARRRYGRNLPPPPAKLSNRPPRRPARQGQAS
jgi:hypothetical protein